MADGYRIIGAGMSFLFPLQGHSAATDFCETQPTGAISSLSSPPSGCLARLRA
ncbi:hypothetical protein V1293_003926 [Bradyrhizobium sp. AZCC 1693]